MTVYRLYTVRDKLFFIKNKMDKVEGEELKIKRNIKLE